MAPELDTSVTLYFSSHRGVTYEVLDTVLSHIAKAMRKLEKKDFEVYVQSLQASGVSQVTIDAARFRFDKLDYRRFVTITKASPGSIELVILLGGAAYWVIDKTLGETLKDAWVQSPTHAKLVTILTNRIGDRSAEISQVLKPHRLTLIEGMTVSSSEAQEPQAPLRITFNAALGSEAEPIPPTSNLIGQRRQSDA